MVKSGTIKEDAAQRKVLHTLEELRIQLSSSRSGKITGLFRKKPTDISGGVYIWGNVGRGKSMLMDLFFEHVSLPGKQRIHFHAFMLEVHNQIHRLRQANQKGHSHIKDGGADPVAALAKQIASETPLLCFDELQAPDVTDATLLFRLFSGLLDAGTIIVSTSNHPPASLYTGGVQRERFAKFTALIEERMKVVSLTSPHDYRYQQIKSLERRYVWPLGSEADAFITDAIGQLCASPHPRKETLSIKGRKLNFSLYDEDMGRFTFRELCEHPLGPADYLEVARRCGTLILTHIPKLPPEKRNEAKRFVTLIDALYEQRVRLLCTAAVPPEQIYGDGDGAFEFRRTVSRLAEMQSAQWGDK